MDSNLFNIWHLQLCTLNNHCILYQRTHACMNRQTHTHIHTCGCVWVCVLIVFHLSLDNADNDWMTCGVNVYKYEKSFYIRYSSFTYSFFSGNEQIWWCLHLFFNIWTWNKRGFSKLNKYLRYMNFVPSLYILTLPSKCLILTVNTTCTQFWGNRCVSNTLKTYVTVTQYRSQWLWIRNFAFPVVS